MKTKIQPFFENITFNEIRDAAFDMNLSANKGVQLLSISPDAENDRDKTEIAVFRFAQKLKKSKTPPAKVKTRVVLGGVYIGSIDADTSQNILQLKKKIQQMLLAPHLLFVTSMKHNGIDMEDHRKLYVYDVQDGDTITCAFSSVEPA